MHPVRQWQMVLLVAGLSLWGPWRGAGGVEAPPHLPHPPADPNLRTSSCSSVTEVTEETGTISVEGTEQYPSQHSCLWVLNITRHPHPVILINVTRLHLPAAPDHSLVNGDFLMVAAGEVAGAGRAVMLYGRRSSPQQVMVDGPCALVYLHVLPSSSVSNSSTTLGFSLTYAATAGTPPTTAAPVTEPPQPEEHVASVDLNGVPEEGVTDEAVRETVAAIVTDYASVNNLTLMDANLTDRVHVLANKTCNNYYRCQTNCRASTVSMWPLDPAEMWLYNSSEHTLSHILADCSYYHYWQTLSPDISVCGRCGQRWWVVVVVVMVGAVLGTIFACVWQRNLEAERLKREWEKLQQDVAEDRKRRVSGGVTFLGFDSVASRASHHPSLPFSAHNQMDYDSDDSNDLARYDYKEYDPDQLHPGLPVVVQQEETVADGIEVILYQRPGIYINEAYVDDEAWEAGAASSGPVVPLQSLSARSSRDDQEINNEGEITEWKL